MQDSALQFGSFHWEALLPDDENEPTNPAAPRPLSERFNKLELDSSLTLKRLHQTAGMVDALATALYRRLDALHAELALSREPPKTTGGYVGYLALGAVALLVGYLLGAGL